MLIIILQTVLGCSSDQPLCISCLANECLICVESLLINGKCESINYKVNNCVFYKEDGICKNCQLGYFLTTENECEKIIIGNCLEIYKYQLCTMCQSPMRTKGGKCDPGNTCETVNCQLCTVDKLSAEICFKCQSGSVLQVTDEGRTVCTMGLKEMEGCLMGGLEGHKSCQICELGYYMENGICLATSEYDFNMKASNG